MNYYYRSIPSEQMCDYEDYYKSIAEILPIDCNIIEVGISEGRGILMMAAIMKSLGKKCRIWGVDKWDYGGDIQRDLVTKNIINSGEDNIEILGISSLDASCRFPDDYFHLVFIDSAHTYEYTKAELRLWINKVQPNYFLSGHDYIYSEEVKMAVSEMIPETYLKVIDTTFNLGVWQVQKTENFKLLK